jgi:glyoxylase-like metal-dependent hydrolase (beta-lactamase superfamily II)
LDAVNSGVTVNTFRVGDFQVFTLVENSHLSVEIEEFFPDLPNQESVESSWAMLPPFLDASRRMVLAIQAFLVLTPTMNIVVDTCVGRGKSRRRAEFNMQRVDWLDALTLSGHTVQSIDTVVLTHLHVDHVGGATVHTSQGWEPTFPTARYLIPEAEWRYWSSPPGTKAMERTGDYLRDSVTPLMRAGLAEFVTGDLEIVPGVRLVEAAGHTPGNMIVKLESQGERAVLAGDLLHHAVQCALPDLSTRYCTNGTAASERRKELLEEVTDTDTLLVPTHFPLPSVGTVERRDRGSYEFLYAPNRVHVLGQRPNGAS